MPCSALAPRCGAIAFPSSLQGTELLWVARDTKGSSDVNTDGRRGIPPQAHLEFWGHPLHTSQVNIYKNPLIFRSALSALEAEDSQGFVVTRGAHRPVQGMGQKQLLADSKLWS